MYSFSQSYYLRDNIMTEIWLRKALDKGIADFNVDRNSYRIKSLKSLSDIIQQHFGKTISDSMLLSKFDEPPYII